MWRRAKAGADAYAILPGETVDRQGTGDRIPETESAFAAPIDSRKMAGMIGRFRRFSDARPATIAVLSSIAVLVCFASIADSAGAAAPLAPEMVDPGDPAWDDLWRLELSGALPAGIASMRVASRGEIATWIAEAESYPDADPASLARLRRAFARELRRVGLTRIDRETPSALCLRDRTTSPRDSLSLDGARSELRIGPTLRFEGRTIEDRGRIEDSTRAGIYGVYLISSHAAFQGDLYISHIEGGRGIGDPLINHTDILYLSEGIGATFSTGELRLRLARTRRRWGDGPSDFGSLLLDQRASPITSLEWDLDLPARIRFSSWTGTLNAFEKRGIAAHRLDVPIGRDLRIAISEGVRYSGGFGEPLYVVGLLPYTLVQRLEAQDTSVASLRKAQHNNVLADAEVIWRPRRGGLVYGEFLIDDLPAATSYNPARVGARLGIATYHRIAGAPVEIDFEAAKIGRYVYATAYSVCECDWIHQDRAIGTPDGPDQESLRLRASRSLSRDHRIEIGLLYANRGAARLGTAWSRGPESDSSSHLALEVSGPVERERRASFLWRWDPRDNLFTEVNVGLSSIHDAGNRPTRGYDERFIGSLRAGWRL